jgi:hypothetical protein
MCVHAYLLCMCVSIFKRLKQLTDFHQNGLHIITVGFLIAAVTNNKMETCDFVKVRQ